MNHPNLSDESKSKKTAEAKRELAYLAVGNECTNAIEVVDANGTVIATLINEETEVTPSMRAYAALFAAAPELLDKCKTVVAWLDRLAGAAAERAKDKRFITLAEANAADAKNYKATADDIRKVIAKAEGAA